nr:hypothetical protein [Tanacetum cinerariifolium]
EGGGVVVVGGVVTDMVVAAWCRQWGGEAAGGVGVEVEMAAEERAAKWGCFNGGVGGGVVSEVAVHGVGG